MKHFITAIAAVFISYGLLAVNGEISGQIKNESGEPLPFASVMLEMNDMKLGVKADEYGKYTFKPLDAGIYKMTVSFVNYQTFVYTDISLSEDQLRTVDIELKVAVSDFDIVIKPIPKDLFDGGYGGCPPVIIKRKDIAIIPSNHGGITDIIAKTTPRIYQSDPGKPLHFSGSRDDASVFIVDGVKVMGKLGLINNSVEELLVYSGGIPAKYGDSTGGVVVITTRSYFTERRP